MADLKSELVRWQNAQIGIVDEDVPTTILSAVAAQLAEDELEYEAFLTEAYYGERHEHTPPTDPNQDY